MDLSGFRVDLSGFRVDPVGHGKVLDPRAYHRFVRESEAYLRDGKVKGRRQVFLLSYYLTGKAVTFTLREYRLTKTNGLYDSSMMNCSIYAFLSITECS